MNKWVERLIVVVAILCLLSCIGPVFLVEFFGRLFLGWGLYLRDTLPQISVSWPDVALGVVELVVFLTGLHLLLRCWMARPGDASAQPWPLARSLALGTAILTLFVAGISVTGLVHQIAWLATSNEPLLDGSIRQAARSSQSQDHIHNLVIALSDYELSRYSDDQFAAGGTFDASGRGLHGWMTNLLPFVERKLLYEQIDLSIPWDETSNAAAMREQVDVYLNPGVGDSSTADGRFGLAHYAANSQMMGVNRGMRREDVTDGLSNTLLTGELAHDLPAWGSPTNFRDPAIGLNRRSHGFDSPWTTGEVQFGFGDGKVSRLSPDIDPAVLRALSSPAAGDTVPEGSR
jgi:hypothetical protein